MSSTSYLIFSLRQVLYGIDTTLVKEIFPLPELTPIPETPTDIVGLLNLRGIFVPVMHLDKRLGHALQPFHLNDSVIVVEWQGLQVGMIIQQVQEVRDIDQTSISSDIAYGRVSDTNTAFVAGVAQLESHTVILLNPETLIRQPEAVASLIYEIDDTAAHWSGDFPAPTVVPGEAIPDWEALLAGSSATEALPIAEFSKDEQPSAELSIAEVVEAKQPDLPRVTMSFYELYCPEASPQEQAVFSQRAENLRQAIVLTTEVMGLTPFAVVDLGGERFGVDVNWVQEFTQIRNLTSIPCCPAHIVGNMNLRGEIVTLVDIRSVLNLPPTSVKIGSQTVVVQVEDVVAGLAVDSVEDVVYIHPSQIKPIPIAVPESSKGYLQGTVAIADKTLTVLDLPKMLAQGGLSVNDE